MQADADRKRAAAPAPKARCRLRVCQVGAAAIQPRVQQQNLSDGLYWNDQPGWLCRLHKKLQNAVFDQDACLQN